MATMIGTERAFLGYGEVRRIEADGQEVVSTYKNDSIFVKGLLERQETYDSNDNLLRRQLNEYDATLKDGAEAGILILAMEGITARFSPGF